MEDYKEIEYMGTKVFVTTNLDIIWNGSKRNIYYNHDGYAVCSIKTSKGWRSISVARLVAIAIFQIQTICQKLIIKIMIGQITI